MNYTHGEEFRATSDQTEAICHDPAPLMILAGAGTGKTTTLLYRYIYLIENLGIKPAKGGIPANEKRDTIKIAPNPT